jgi:hypothetical protein
MVNSIYEAEAHVWIFEARTLSTQPVRRRCGMCGVYRMEPRCREPGIQTHGARSGETLRLARVPRLGSCSYLRAIRRCRPLTDISPGRLLGGLAIGRKANSFDSHVGFLHQESSRTGARRAVANWWISNREGSVSQGEFRSIH